MEAYSLLANLRKGMQSSSEQPFSWEGTLRDDPNNGCEGDYGVRGRDEYVGVIGKYSER